MSFDLFGFDAIFSAQIFGAWVGCITLPSGEKRCGLCIHYDQQHWRFELCYIRVI